MISHSPNNATDLLSTDGNHEKKKPYWLYIFFFFKYQDNFLSICYYSYIMWDILHTSSCELAVTMETIPY